MDDRVSVTNLLYEYAFRIDAGDFTGLAELFRHVWITAEGADAGFEGEAGALRMYESSTRRYEDGTPRSKHVVSNVVVELQPDQSQEPARATARSYYTVLQAVPGALALQPIVSGRYHDAFEKVEGVWRFTSRHIFVDLVGDLSRHLLFDL